MKSLHTFLVLTLLFTSSVWAQKLSPSPVNTYRNPVIAGDFADPSVIRVGDTYFAAGTSSEWGPAYPIYTSKNLTSWEAIFAGLKFFLKALAQNSGHTLTCKVKF